LDEDNGENSEHDIEMMCKAMGKETFGFEI